MNHFAVEYTTVAAVKSGTSSAVNWYPTGAKVECDKAEALRRFRFLLECGLGGVDPEGGSPPYVVRIKDLRKATAHDFGKLDKACSYVMLSQYAFPGDEPAGPWAKELVN